TTWNEHHLWDNGAHASFSPGYYRNISANEGGIQNCNALVHFVINPQRNVNIAQLSFATILYPQLQSCFLTTLERRYGRALRSLQGHRLKSHLAASHTVGPRTKWRCANAAHVAQIILHNYGSVPLRDTPTCYEEQRGTTKTLDRSHVVADKK